MKIAVDFDGTCVDHRYPEVGPDAPHVVNTLLKLLEAGHTLTLYTMRSAGPLQDAIDWFKNRGIHLTGIQFDPTQGSWSASNKCYAEKYVDDAAFGAPLIKPEGFEQECIDWLRVREDLLGRSETSEVVQKSLPGKGRKAEKKIVIPKSETADTRTCDFKNVDKETLLSSSEQHIRDIAQGMGFFCDMLIQASMRHDHDKITGINQFHEDFVTGFKQTKWWDNHRKVNRHHIEKGDGVPDDVNLIDVIEHIVDCVMAGMARSGSVREVTADPKILSRAFKNTVDLLMQNVEVKR